MTSEYSIKQLSIFAPNTPGTLAEIAKIFLDSGVNISAFCIAEANNFGVVRAVVDKPDTAFKAFEKKNYLLKFTDVLAVKMSDVPGGLYEVASKFGAAGLNIEYAYASRSAATPTLVVYVSNTDILPETAVEKILASGLVLVRAAEMWI
ncbi:MAG TPA: acetolactate synthase [Methanocorpusculum sp.]|nr:acetolactate synthase [Methanocorpusculum sp.]